MLNTDKNDVVTKSEIHDLLSSFNPSIWSSAEAYVDKVLKYMRLTFNAHGDSFNLGGLISFGEILRTRLPNLLDKFLK